MEKGDTVWMLDGPKVPMILRESRSKPGEYRFVGPCYLHAAERLHDVCSICGQENQRFVSQTEDDLSSFTNITQKRHKQRKVFDGRYSEQDKDQKISPLFLSN